MIHIYDIHIFKYISKAQQSCISVTALEQKIMRGLSIRINQKSMERIFKIDQNTDQEPIKYQSKIDRKSIENQSSIDRKSIGNLSNIDKKSIKITAGAKNVAHFVLGAVLEASWRSLRGQHSSKLASQSRRNIHNKSMQKSIKKIDAF